MAITVVMPALEMAQETGKLIRWLKREGEAVIKGEPIMEVETDKVTVEIEATASGTLGQVSAHEGDRVPVGQVIALILTADEALQVPAGKQAAPVSLAVSPVARKIAEEYGLDLSQVKVPGERLVKADVLAYLAGNTTPIVPAANGYRLKSPASPKARRLAAEAGLDITTIPGSGLDGAVLTADIQRAEPVNAPTPVVETVPDLRTGDVDPISAVWQVMADRMTASWTHAPHFYLMRDVRANGLSDMRARISPSVEKRGGIQPTYTDLLIKVIAIALRDHPRLYASWAGKGIQVNDNINIGLAVGVEDGLVVPVIHNADSLTISQIATHRKDLVTRANAHRLRLADISGSTFTLTNLGMYNVDAFLAILNPPQAAILAVGRIADRVVPENGQVVIRPMMTITLSSDHRVVDGVRAAKFLDDLSGLIEEPWGVLA